MKKLAIILCLFFAFTSSTYAQSFAFVNTEQILEQLPAYQNAQKQIDATVASWNKEVQQRYKQIDDAYKAFQAEQVLLSDTERRQREEQIVTMEKETREFQKKRFGSNGDLQKKREELVKPIQDEVYVAIEKVANRKKYDFILDRSSGASILFANPKYDVTDEVLKEVK
ncbi:MAG: OmpH family outer membrane protein [Chitinophagales bacterium]